MLWRLAALVASLGFIALLATPSDRLGAEVGAFLLPALGTATALSSLLARRLGRRAGVWGGLTFVFLGLPAAVLAFRPSVRGQRAPLAWLAGALFLITGALAPLMQPEDVSESGSGAASAQRPRDLAYVIERPYPDLPAWIVVDGRRVPGESKGDRMRFRARDAKEIAAHVQGACEPSVLRVRSTRPPSRLACSPATGPLALDCEPADLVGDTDPFDRTPEVVLWIDNRKGPQSSLLVGKAAISIAADAKTLVAIPASGCSDPVGAQLDRRPIGSLELQTEEERSRRSLARRYAMAVVDTSGKRCYELDRVSYGSHPIAADPPRGEPTAFRRALLHPVGDGIAYFLDEPPATVREQRGVMSASRTVLRERPCR